MPRSTCDSQDSERPTRPARAACERPRRRRARAIQVRQLIESVNDTLKGQLDLEGHGGRSPAGVAIRVAQRILAMAPALWRNYHPGPPPPPSLLASAHNQGVRYGRVRNPPPASGSRRSPAGPPSITT